MSDDRVHKKIVELIQEIDGKTKDKDMDPNKCPVCNSDNISKESGDEIIDLVASLWCDDCHAMWEVELKVVDIKNIIKEN